MTDPALSSASGARSAATLILGATAFAGIAGYLVTWLVFRSAGPAEYAVFAVFWAAMYLVVGALSGIQQEVARATRPIEPGSRATPSRVRNFALAAALLVFAAVTCTAPLWVGEVFPDQGWLLVWPLAVGTASYVLVAALCGSLYGVSQWRSLAMMIGADALLRLGLLGIALAASGDVLVLAWVVALPFPLAIVLLWPAIRRGFVGRSDIDVTYGPLVWNVVRVSVASTSTAVLVSGFPLLLGVVAERVSPALVGVLIFTITLTRAPLIVTVMSLQSFLVVKFRDNRSAGSLMGQVLVAISAGAVVLAGAGWLFGPAVLGWVSGETSSLGGEVIAALVGSSSLVAALCVTGSALLARSEHVLFSIGWLLAAVSTVVVMLLPLDIVTRACVALAVGPVMGLVVHGAGLRMRRQDPRRAKATESPD